MSINKYLDDETEEFEPPEFHRDQDLDDVGVSEVVVERFVKYRLPQLMKIKEEMDQGKQLTDGEIELLSRVVKRAHQLNHFVYEYPQYKELVAKTIDLVHDITGEAVENAEHRQPD
jgi:hypothetical protein